MKLHIQVILFCLCSAIIGVAFRNQITTYTKNRNALDISKGSNKNILLALDNIKTELPDGDYSLNNVARLTLKDGNTLVLCPTISISGDTFTETPEFLSHYNNVDLVNNQLYQNITFKKFTTDKPNLEIIESQGKLKVFTGKSAFNVLSDVDAIKVIRGDS